MQGTLYIISAPSGTGKTSLVTALVDAIDHVKLSVSYTTRERRSNELEGIHYHFVDEATFDDMIKANDFLEHDHHYGHSYGTSRQWVEQALARGEDVILEIEWRGGKQVTDVFTDAVSVFILPPNKEALVERLEGRGQDNQEVIANRLKAVKDEIQFCKDYDYIVVNDQFEVALSDLRSIMRAERCLREKQLVRQEALIASFE
jgi:guanylate kinase